METLEELLKLKRERDRKRAEVERLEGNLAQLQEVLAREEEKV